MSRALLLIDIQRDYFPGGRHPLVGSDDAADVASAVLDGFRRRAEPVVHVQHSWDDPGAAYLQPGTPGPRTTSASLRATTSRSSSSAGRTRFLAPISSSASAGEGIDQLVVAGMMTSMCIDATARAAVDLGFGVTVVGDACAAPDLEHAGVQVSGGHVHAAFLAALADGYAEVVAADALTAAAG